MEEASVEYMEPNALGEGGYVCLSVYIGVGVWHRSVIG